MGRLEPHVLRLVRQFGRDPDPVVDGRTHRRGGGGVAGGDAHLLGESVRVFYEHVGTELVRAMEGGTDHTVV